MKIKRRIAMRIKVMIEDQDQDQNKDEDAGPFEAPFFPSRLCEVPLTKSHNVHVNRT